MTEEKIVKFNIDDEKLLDIASEKRERGDYDGALSTLYYMQDRGVRLIDLYAEFALVFMELGLNTHAVKYWFKYIACAPKSKHARAYNGLGACFYYLGNYGMSGYYFEKQVSADQSKDYQFDHIMLEYYDSITGENKPDFYVCYPPKMVDPEILMTDAENLFEQRKFEEAIEIYENISEDSDLYSDAQIRKSACYVYLQDFDKAVETVAKLIEKDDSNKNAILNMLGLLSTINQRDDIPKYLQMAEKIDFTDSADCYKLATVYCDEGNDERAKDYLEKAIADDKYDVNSNFLLAMVYYNLQMFDKSEERFLLCYRLTKSSIAKYYVNLVEKTKNGGKFAKIYYVFDVQADEEKRRNGLIKNIIKNQKRALSKIDKSEVIDLLDWAFSVDSDLIEPLTSVLLKTSSVLFRKYFLDRLLDPFVSDDVKSLIISELVQKGYDKKISMTFGVFFTKLQILRAEFDKEKNELFTKAYAIAFGKLAPIDPELSYKIRDGAYKLYYELKENGNIKKIDDVNSLSGAIAVYSQLEISRKKSLIANYFYTQTGLINDIIILAKE